MLPLLLQLFNPFPNVIPPRWQIGRLDFLRQLLQMTQPDRAGSAFDFMALFDNAFLIARGEVRFQHAQVARHHFFKHRQTVGDEFRANQLQILFQHREIEQRLLLAVIACRHVLLLIVSLRIPEFFDGRGQRRHRQRFAQHVVHPRFQILFFIFEYVGGQRHQRRQRVAGITAVQFARDIKPGHVRQLDIQQHQIKLAGAEHLQRRFAGHGHLDAATEFFQHRRCHDNVELNIFHQQHMQRGQRHLVVVERIFHFFRHARRLHRQNERRALPRFAGYRDIAAHTFRETARHRKPNPCARRRFAALAVFHLVIHGENLVLLLLRNTDAGIFHFKA
ncbi:hypothetical protein BN128_3640 [Cronobacter sakazakii 696]|nr:hypothetical protein BN128_3640 [Cronobacter sakazakii 696]